ncbi:MAG TPA: lipoyl(octanoyl) transferase LipB [Thermoanaerobaculia bacterium]|nr:lipoyl(octanoyl) transferase LipB [Thermoanaerobaculia bacterium]
MAGTRLLRTGFLGRVSYAAAEALQLRLRDALLRGEGEDHLLLLEHPSVFTLGRNARSIDVVADEGWLRRRGVEVHETDRGGQATYHGPGQLVGYPVLDLKPDRRDVRRYVRDLEEVLIRTLADYGIEGEPALSPRPVGVWVGPRKIASLGIHLRHWVTTHGFALNVTTDLSFFSGIVACGMPAAPMTSIRELAGAEPGIEEVAARVAGHFCEVFERVAAPIAASDLAHVRGATTTSTTSRRREGPA